MECGNNCGSLVVAISHAHSIVSAGLFSLLRQQSGLNVRQCSSEKILEWSPPDVIIFDHASALEYLAGERAAANNKTFPRILVVTSLRRETAVIAALAAGVHGYLLQDSSPEQLVQALEKLANDGNYLSPGLARCREEISAGIDLTPRENDVLQLLAEGMCNKAIARDLGIGVGTVKSHVKGVFDKLGAKARTQAVVLATRRGLVEVRA